MNGPRVAVIGGGMAGLAAACRLQGLGLVPVVFEADSVPGGVVRTHADHGWLADTGPVMVAEPHPDVRAMLDAAGLEPLTLRIPAAARRQYVVHRGTPVVVPTSTADLVATPLLSLAGRLRMLKEPFVAPLRDVEEETADAFARRRVGEEVAERMFDPRVGSISGGDPTKLLARYAFPAEVEYERSAGSLLRGASRARMDARRRARKQRNGGSWSCQGGMGELPRQLAASIATPIRFEARVTRISVGSTGVTVTTMGTGSEAFQAVVLAVPAPGLQHITVDAADAGELGAIAGLPSASMAVVSLGYRRADVEHPLDGFRLLVPSRERRNILSAVFPSSAIPGRAPEGHVLLTAFLGGMRRPELLEHSDADLIDIVRGEFRELLGAEGDGRWSDVTRWRDAVPQAVAGHGARLAAAEQVEGAIPTIAFCGAWRDGLAVSDTMLGGVRAAERLALRCGWTPDPSHP